MPSYGHGLRRWLRSNSFVAPSLQTSRKGKKQATERRWRRTGQEKSEEIDTFHGIGWELERKIGQSRYFESLFQRVKERQLQQLPLNFKKINWNLEDGKTAHLATAEKETTESEKQENRRGREGGIRVM